MTIMMSIPRSDVAQSPEPRVSISLRLTKGAHITTERFAALMSEVLFTTVDERGFFSAIESGAMARGRVPWRGFDSTAPTLLVKRPLWHGGACHGGGFDSRQRKATRGPYAVAAAAGFLPNARIMTRADSRAPSRVRRYSLARQPPSGA